MGVQLDTNEQGLYLKTYEDEKVHYHYLNTSLRLDDEVEEEDMDRLLDRLISLSSTGITQDEMYEDILIVHAEQENLGIGEISIGPHSNLTYVNLGNYYDGYSVGDMVGLGSREINRTEYLAVGYYGLQHREGGPMEVIHVNEVGILRYGDIRDTSWVNIQDAPLNNQEHYIFNTLYGLPVIQPLNTSTPTTTLDPHIFKKYVESYEQTRSYTQVMGLLTKGEEGGLLVRTTNVPKAPHPTHPPTPLEVGTPFTGSNFLTQQGYSGTIKGGRVHYVQTYDLLSGGTYTHKVVGNEDGTGPYEHSPDGVAQPPLREEQLSIIKSLLHTESMMLRDYIDMGH